MEEDRKYPRRTVLAAAAGLAAVAGVARLGMRQKPHENYLEKDGMVMLRSDREEYPYAGYFSAGAFTDPSQGTEMVAQGRIVAIQYPSQLKSELDKALRMQAPDLKKILSGAPTVEHPATLVKSATGHVAIEWSDQGDMSITPRGGDKQAIAAKQSLVFYCGDSDSPQTLNIILPKIKAMSAPMAGNPHDIPDVIALNKSIILDLSKADTKSFHNMDYTNAHFVLQCIAQTATRFRKPPVAPNVTIMMPDKLFVGATPADVVKCVTEFAGVCTQSFKGAGFVPKTEMDLRIQLKSASGQALPAIELPVGTVTMPAGDQAVFSRVEEWLIDNGAALLIDDSLLKDLRIKNNRPKNDVEIQEIEEQNTKWRRHADVLPNNKEREK